ncbi:MAG: GtrA family protein [Candidatus Nanohaloarchaea archaeon]
MNLDVFKDYRKIIMFGLVGGLGLFIDNAVLFLLVDILNINLYISKALSAEASIAVMFILNNSVTFREFEAQAYAFIRSNIVRIGGVIIAFIAIAFGELIGVNYLVSNTAGIAAGFVFNYYFERVLTWNST